MTAETNAVDFQPDAANTAAPAGDDDGIHGSPSHYADDWPPHDNEGSALRLNPPGMVIPPLVRAVEAFYDSAKRAE